MMCFPPSKLASSTIQLILNVWNKRLLNLIAELDHGSAYDPTTRRCWYYIRLEAKASTSTMHSRKDVQLALKAP